jgi:hypothetical protein
VTDPFFSLSHLLVIHQYNEVMKLLHFFNKRWWLVYGLGLTLCIFYFMMGSVGEPSAEADTIVYTQVILRGMGIVAIMPVIFLLIAGIVLLTRQRKDLDSQLLWLIVLPIFMVLLGFFKNQPTICDPRIYTLETVNMDGRIYNLSRFCTFRVAVFECDSIMVVCNTIHRGPTPISTLEFERKCVRDDARPHLATDNHTLSLIIGCETVFSYHPP